MDRSSEMKNKSSHEYYEGPEAGRRFKSAMKTILSVPRFEMEQREKRYQEEQSLKPKRGPKRKVTSSASRDRGSDG
jgi:hypothetical protein